MGWVLTVPWFKVDDTLHGHPKARKSGLEATGLWTVCGAYCMAYKTDGFVPAWYVSTWPRGAKLAAVLVEAQRWDVSEKDGESGWMFHDWSDYQPSSEEIEKDREHARERQRRRREGLRSIRSESLNA